jgi:hypothetical protein
MFYQPKLVREMWDTWLYSHEGIHHLFLLHKSGRDITSTPAQWTPWDGISTAVSRDGVHYEEIGPILEMRSDAEWLGTGSVWKTEDGFVMNFSEDRGGVQAIFFARSDDLVHWDRLPDVLRCDPDPRWYDNTSTGRWDCIWSQPKPEGGFVGYLTARPWNRNRGMSCESIGMVESEDGIHWKAIPSPEIDWGDWPVLNVSEVGAIERIGNRYYLMLFVPEGGLGGRQKIKRNLDHHQGMRTFIGDSLKGPFRPDTGAYRLLASSGAHFSRFYPAPEGMLVNHHSIESVGEGPLIWMAPLKKAVIDSEGHLRLGYWEGNDAVKGERIGIDLRSAERAYPKTEVEEWQASPTRIEADEPHRGGILLLENVFDIHKGIVLEGFLEIQCAPKRWGGIGFYFEFEHGTKGTGVMVETRGVTEIAAMDSNGTGGFVPYETVEFGIREDKRYPFRLLARRTMLELYVDDLLVQCISLSGVPTGRLGLIFESCRVVFDDLKAWEMNLDNGA